MMRILGITLPDQKRIEIALTTIYGIGRSRAQHVLRKAEIDFAKKPKDLSDAEENKIRKIIEEGFKIEGDLKRLMATNIKRLKDIKAYRGSRHARGLPSRGQRTKTNSRTRRGNIRKTMGTGRRKLDKK
ncbi:MAG TPA: 30S ribosomal protein S13 [Candidatus Paceibacterota bacterium]